LDAAEIFKGEIEEMTEKVSVSIHNLNLMKETYFEYRSKLASYKTESDDRGQDVGQYWEFSPRLIFHRYDQFLTRLSSIQVSIIASLYIYPSSNLFLFNNF